MKKQENSDLKFSTSSSNTTTSLSTTNTTYKSKAHPWAHAWLPHMPIFSWPPSKNRCFSTPHNLLPLTRLRFIDDTFMLWTYGPTALTNFLSHINCFRPTIKFTHQQSHTSLNFLDTTIILTPNTHYSAHSTPNPPTKAYSSITPLTIPTPVKKALSTAKHSDTDASSPTTMTSTNIYNDYIKSS